MLSSKIQKKIRGRGSWTSMTNSIPLIWAHFKIFLRKSSKENILFQRYYTLMPSTQGTPRDEVFIRKCLLINYPKYVLTLAFRVYLSALILLTIYILRSYSSLLFSARFHFNWQFWTPQNMYTYVESRPIVPQRQELPSNRCSAMAGSWSGSQVR